MDRITRYIISLFTALAVSVAALAANAGPEAAGEAVPASQSGTATSNPCFSATSVIHTSGISQRSVKSI